MNDLCTEVGYKSINHAGEQLCGDHIDIIETDENSLVIVLADGLGSGVKASILSTLTSKIISTMISAGLPLEECVSTIAATLPVCSQRGVAYSTFTLIHIKDNETAEIVQYDNPASIFIREGQAVDYPKTEMTVEGKKITKAIIKLEENDVIVAMSDGCPHAGAGISYNYGWKAEDIADFMADMSYAGHTAKTLATLLIDECNKLYEGRPSDDATAVVVRLRKREPINIMFGPPANRDDCNKMAALFFSKEGKHIVCGGTTSSIVADYLRKPIKMGKSFSADIPPTSEIEGVDLVTEGVITMSRVYEYAKDYLSDNSSYEKWGNKKDGASRICQLLFEEATDINFFVGRAVNPAHQNPALPISFNIKMNIVEELSKCLRQMGKRIKVSYF